MKYFILLNFSFLNHYFYSKKFQIFETNTRIFFFNFFIEIINDKEMKKKNEIVKKYEELIAIKSL